MRITRVDARPEQYDVLSESGHTYRVTYCGSGDADPEYVALWECTCPAAEYHPDRLCKHIRAVVKLTNPDDYAELLTGQSRDES